MDQPYQAEQDLKQARKLQERTLRDRLEQARQHLPNHPHRALPLLDNLLQEFPGFEQAYWQRAQVYHRLGKLHLALQDISRLVEINPSAEHLLTKATWLDQAGYALDAYQTAFQAYSKSQKGIKAQNSLEIEYHLAKLAEKIYEYQQAYRYYSLVWSRKPDACLQLQMGRVAFKSKQYAKALDHLKQAIITAAPTGASPGPAVYGEALYFRGRIHEHEQKKHLAADDWRRAQKISFPQRPDLLYRLGKNILRSPRI